MITRRTYYCNPRIPATEGRIFKGAPAEEVMDFLENRKMEYIQTEPLKIRLVLYDSFLILEHPNGKLNEYPVRLSFLNKLMNWYKMPNYPIVQFSPESLVILANEILRSIRGTVILVVENGEALSILSPKYIPTFDQEIFKQLKELRTTRIDRDDFITRACFEERTRIEPKVGDFISCGIHLLNSETGFSAFQLSAYLLRLVCKNGAVHNILGDDQEDKFYHHGLDQRHVQSYINSFIERLDPYFHNLEEKLKSLANTHFDPENEQLKQNIASRFPWWQWNKILRDFAAEQGTQHSMYDFYNFLTNMAKSDDLHERINLEEIAGRLTEI